VTHDVQTGNRTIVRLAFEAWQSDAVPIAELFSDEMTWRIEGNSLAAGEYQDKKEFLERVLAPFGARFVNGQRFRPTTIRMIVADGDTVVVIWDGAGIANDGVAYTNSYAWILHLDNGLVVDGTAFFDGSAFDDLWRRVEPA
jgi:ketosteroid isomerase-like protein